MIQSIQSGQQTIREAGEENELLRTELGKQSQGNAIGRRLERGEGTPGLGTGEDALGPSIVGIGLASNQARRLELSDACCDVRSR